MEAEFSLDGTRIVTASWDHTARVWNTANGQVLSTLRGHTNYVNTAAFSPDGHRIGTASWDHTVRVWNTADGRSITTLEGHTGTDVKGAFTSQHTVTGAQFSPDGLRVVAINDN